MLRQHQMIEDHLTFVNWFAVDNYYAPNLAEPESNKGRE
jgi:hypothetical protein